MKYNTLYTNTQKVTLAPVLPYITWGLIQDSQNKEGNPQRRILILFKVKEKLIDENIYYMIYIYTRRHKI